MNSIIILGSTGSIGKQTLEVIDFLDEGWEITALSAYNNIDLLEKQIRKYSPKYVIVVDEKAAHKLKDNIKNISCEIYSGEEKLSEVVEVSEVDIVINGIVGYAGLKPSLATLEAGHKLGLANKESLVVGGHLIKKKLSEKNGELLPVDSEHNAIFNILSEVEKNEVSSILLTASGGPFLYKNKSELANVTVAEALDHPNWNMGNKITIDSATMMNKGLEVIEAYWLFDKSYDEINVVIHPESIIHSMVEFRDNTITAEMGVPDMKAPIQNVLTYPEKKVSSVKKLNLFELGKINFLKPDLNKFPNLELAYKAGKIGESMPVVLNAANEVAVNAFLNKKISFLQISNIIEEVMDKHKIIYDPTIEDIIGVDEWARKVAKEDMKK